MQLDHHSKPAPADRETLPSFLSRLAAWHRVPSAEFASEMGFSFRRITVAHQSSAKKLGTVGRLNPAQIEELRSWTGELLGEVRMAFRGETYVSRALRSPTMRACSRCLRDDLENGGDRVAESMAFRGDWQLKYVYVCLKHRRTLVPLWTETAPLKRYDFQAHFKVILPQLMSGALDGDEVVPTSFEIWLDRRLKAGEDDTAMSQFGLCAALEASRLLGAELLRHEGDVHKGLSEIDRARKGLERGFEIVSKGEAGIAEALEKMAGLATKGSHKPKFVYGMFYEALARSQIEEPEFDPFRRLLREQVLRTWPIAAGETLLGEIVHERRIHSITTASQEISYTVHPLRQALVDAGVISATDKRSSGIITFDANKHDAFLKELPKLVGADEMARSIGATEHQFVALVREELIAPYVKVRAFRAPWRVADGSAFMEKLFETIEPLPKNTDGWEHIHKAAYRSRRGLRPILDGIASGRVQVGRSERKRGYAAIYVRTSDVTRLIEKRFSKFDDQLMTVPEFARSVGLRARQRFAALVEAGLTPATTITNPASGHERLYITPEDAVAFHHRFLTLSTLSKETSRSYVSTRQELKRSGIKPYTADGKTFGQLYLRSEVIREYLPYKQTQ